MSAQLTISIGQFSTAGRKEANQDFHGACIPAEPLLSSKGIALAIADGISTSTVSRVASESAVKGFLEDYFCTSPAWSVKRSARAVLAATNSWLHSQTRQSQFRYEQDRGYVCTFTAIIFKSTTAHVFHVGDARVYRLRDDTLEQLTEDHRVWMSSEQSYLGKALGVNSQLEIDYQAFSIEPGDMFLLLTDGVHEKISARSLLAHLARGGDLDVIARSLAEDAYAQGSIDNLTVQLARVDSVPDQHVSELQQQLTELPLPPALEPRMDFDGYKIVRELHASHRSHIHLAIDSTSNIAVAIKTPSIDQRDNSEYLERFLLEDWSARRINSPYVVRAFDERRKRNYLYTVLEFIEGQTLAQWMIDNPRPPLEKVRAIVEQVAKGLTAFHRLEMLHQDLRPENIMLDHSGTVRIVDFGSVRVAGLMDLAHSTPDILGTVQYAAPEYFLGASGTPQSDLFSLGVIAYQLLCGRLPFGADIPKRTTKASQRKLRYRSLLDARRDVPAWVDDVLRTATHPDPLKRYADAAEFVHALRYPTAANSASVRRPLIERDPIVFWKAVSLLLAIVVIVLCARMR
jgi:serine/threonine protein phosphatase PrpC